MSVKDRQRAAAESYDRYAPWRRSRLLASLRGALKVCKDGARRKVLAAQIAELEKDLVANPEPLKRNAFAGFCRKKKYEVVA